MAYNPNMYMPQPMTAPMVAPVVQPNWAYQPTQTTTQPVNGLVSVTGMDGARAYQLPPNSSMPLFDKDSDILYVKTTDGAGFPTVRAFRFEPMEQEKAAAPDYVPREEFDALVERVNGLTPAATKATTTRTRKAAENAE